MPILTKAQVHQETGQTEITFQWDEAIRYENTVLWSLNLTDDCGNRRQAGYKIIDDIPVAQFVFDHSASRQINLPIAATLHKPDNVLEVRFPTEILYGAEPGQAAIAQAVLTVDGVDVSHLDLVDDFHPAKEAE